MSDPGEYTELGEGGWNDVTGVAECNGKLFIVSAGTLYTVNLEDGSYEEVGGDTWDVRAMVGFHGRLYIFSGDGALYRVDPSNGEYEELGEGGWADATGAVIVGGKLYATCDNTLYVIGT